MIRATLSLFVITISPYTMAGGTVLDPAMVALAERNRCFNCHDVFETIRGPAWIDVARRYRADADAPARLGTHVKHGSSGIWGNDAMSANRRVSDEHIALLVSWILELDAHGDDQ